MDPPGLPQKIQLVTVGRERLTQYPPPPRRASFPVIVQLDRVGDESRAQYTPPPWPNPAEFPDTAQLVSVGEEP